MTDIVLTTRSKRPSRCKKAYGSLKISEAVPEVTRHGSHEAASDQQAYGPSSLGIPPGGVIQVVVRALGLGRFVAVVDGRELCVSGTPLLSAARTLRAEGIPDNIRLEMVHEGSKVVALRSTVGAAAGRRVSETQGAPRFVPWRPDRLP
jgi:hypothetical protein